MNGFPVLGLLWELRDRGRASATGCTSAALGLASLRSSLAFSEQHVRQSLALSVVPFPGRVARFRSSVRSVMPALCRLPIRAEVASRRLASSGTRIRRSEALSRRVWQWTDWELDLKQFSFDHGHIAVLRCVCAARVLRSDALNAFASSSALPACYFPLCLSASGGLVNPSIFLRMLPA